MAVDENTVRTLMKLGLTEYEARIYAALVKTGQRSATEVSFLGMVPRPKTYGSIKALEKKGFLKVIPSKPVRYMAASPNEVLLPLVERLTIEVEECTRVLESLALSFEASKYVYTERPYEIRDFFGIRGRDKVHRKVVEMISNAKDYVYMVTTANGLIRAYKAYSEALEKAKEMGVDVRIITASSPENEPALRELREVVDIETTDLPLAKHICTDGGEVLFTEAIPDDISGDTGQDVASWTNDPLLARMHRQLFVNLWQRLSMKTSRKKKIPKGSSEGSAEE